MQWLPELVELTLVYSSGDSIPAFINKLFLHTCTHAQPQAAKVDTEAKPMETPAMEVPDSKLVKAALGLDYYFPGLYSCDKHELETRLKFNTNPPPHDDDDNNNDDDDFPLSFEEGSEFECAKPQHPDHIEAESIVIHKGKALDVISLLSGDNDNSSYLGRVDGGVDGIEILKNKYILVCFFYAPILHHYTYSSLLLNLYLLSLELCGKRCDFEMVLVIKLRPEWAKDAKLASSHFQHFISAFSPSCMFIPFEHTARIDRICKSVNTEKLVSGFLVGPDGVVVQDSVAKLAPLAAGKHVFPFTDEKLSFYSLQYWRGKTLEDLLESEGSRVLYNNRGDKQVSVSELARNKVVGLYLCGTGDDIPLLDRIYNECLSKQLEFQIVIVYNPLVTHNSPLILEEVISRFLEERNISWWVFPYSYFAVRRLFNLACSPITDKLLILSYGKLVDYYGEMLVRSLGINAYPFDRESLIQEGIDKIQQVTLESLLEGGSLRRGNHQVVSVTYLRGRNVLILLGSSSAKRSMSLYRLLDKHYNSIKRKHVGFEVVFVNIDNYITNKDRQLIACMPWLVFHPNTWTSHSVAKQLSMWGLEPGPALVAFGDNGRISSLDAGYALKEYGSDAFPFADDVTQQIEIKLKLALDEP